MDKCERPMPDKSELLWEAAPPQKQMKSKE
jgi:hypothetical protein